MNKCFFTKAWKVLNKRECYTIFLGLKDKDLSYNELKNYTGLDDNTLYQSIKSLIKVGIIVNYLQKRENTDETSFYKVTPFGRDVDKMFSKELNKLSKLINAVNNKTRLAIMGLLYFEKLTFEKVVSETKMDENRIAYHLNVLLEACIIQRKKIKYQNTRFGIRLMKDMGYIKEIKKIK